jgi:hypothetical protein
MVSVPCFQEISFGTAHPFRNPGLGNRFIVKTQGVPMVLYQDLLFYTMVAFFAI